MVRGMIAIVVAVAGMNASVLAHDFWIEPSSFRAEAGAPVALALRVGDAYPGDPVPRNNAKIERFAAAGPSGETPIAGRDAAEPAGVLRVESPGLYVIGYRSRPSPVALDAEKFEGYLREKGLDHVIEARAAAGQSDAPASEMFSRCAKTIVQCGSPAAASASDRALGLRYEIIADGNPLALTPGAVLGVTVNYEGTPAAGRLVEAWNPASGAPRQRARTDDLGHARFTIDHPGFWIVASVHMIPAPAESGAAWESLWASLTFEAATPGADAGRSERP